MRTNYSKLIELIEDLRLGVGFDNFQTVDYEHKIKTHEFDNEFIIELDIRRPNHLFLIYDTFKLSEEGNDLVVNYCRETTYLIPLGPKPIPDFLERVFKFKKDQKQELIFVELMKRITEFFGEYNYCDSSYRIAGEVIDEIFRELFN